MCIVKVSEQACESVFVGEGLQVHGELPCCTARAVIEVIRGNCGNIKGHPGHNGEGRRAGF